MTDPALRLANNVRAVLRLISPEHITPMGKRQIERVLDEHTHDLPPAEGEGFIDYSGIGRLHTREEEP